MNDLLLILSCKRHAMLNRLQIVSGYLQLNKPEKAQEYLNQIAQELTWESGICNCKSDLVAMTLLTIQSRLDLAGINLKVTVDAELSSACLEEEELVAILEGLEERIQANLQANPRSSAVDWELEIGSALEGTRWKLTVPVGKSWLEDFLKGLEQRLQGSPGGHRCVIEKKENSLVLFVPKKTTI